MKDYICRICGFNNYPDKYWENDLPSYIICPCCGCEAGNEDYTIGSAKEHRAIWFEKKELWFNLSLKPSNWDFSEQLRNIPEKYK